MYTPRKHLILIVSVSELQENHNKRFAEQLHYNVCIHLHHHICIQLHHHICIMYTITPRYNVYTHTTI